jgi:hypothetical protein
MSNSHLPAEMLDHVVDHLHDARDALRNCCLVSKSWVPRARKHLFADIWFPTATRIQSWKATFPDPSTSPACYADALFIDCSQVVTAVDAEAGGWIRGFSRVEHLEVGTHTTDPDFNESVTPLVPFHGFSPALKSLRVVVPHPLPSQIFNLISSFPLLEDLAVIIIHNGDGSERDEMPPAARPLSPPMFTGSLELYLRGGMKPITRRLLSLPGGIHFRELIWTWFYDEDLSLMMALVERCSHTLQSLSIICNLISTSI